MHLINWSKVNNNVKYPKRLHPNNDQIGLMVAVTYPEAELLLGILTVLVLSE